MSAFNVKGLMESSGIKYDAIGKSGIDVENICEGVAEDCYTCPRSKAVFTDIGTMCCTVEMRMVRAEVALKGKPDWCPDIKGRSF